MLSLELIKDLNDYLQIDQFSDYCTNGLQVEGKKEVKKIATAVSTSLNIIDQAVNHNVDMLIVHHGLFWSRDSYVIQGSKKEKIEKLLKAGITLVAYHLPLDAHSEIGNNWKAAKDLGWKSLEPFGELNGRFIGVKGRFPKQSFEQFQQKLERYYDHVAHTALGGKALIETCALISGGAYKSLEEASKEGLDSFISGNFDEPAWHTAFEEKIHYFALGHAATEKVGPKALANYIKDKYGLEAFFIDEINPF